MPGDSPGRILVINPGSTSTKLAFFRGEAVAAEVSRRHDEAEIAAYRRLWDQRAFRAAMVDEFVAASGASDGLDAVVGRGGLLRPVESGTYAVDDAMLSDLEAARFGEHASNLGAPLASGVAHRFGCPAFVVDPVVVDEMEEVARVSGMPEIRRKSIFHALNQKSAAREVAARLGKRYEECSFIVAHLGGGISVGAHLRGRVVDVNNALDGDGPFSPERTGGLPVGSLLELAASGKLGAAELRRKIVGAGGLVAYCGTNSLQKVEEAAAHGDAASALAVEAMAYQVSKEIAMHGATLRGGVDRIILTGGMAQDPGLVSRIRERVSFLAPIELVPGEREMLSLARGALSVLDGDAPVRRYGGGGQ